jgi:hypothetical protein
MMALDMVYHINIVITVRHIVLCVAVVEASSVGGGGDDDDDKIIGDRGLEASLS